METNLTHKVLKIVAAAKRKSIILTLMEKPKNTDEYIAAFPENVQQVLKQLRETIREAAPQAEEAFSYNIPTFKMSRQEPRALWWA